MNMEIWGPPCGCGGVAAGGAGSWAVTVCRVRAIPPPASRTRLRITVSFLGVIDNPPERFSLFTRGERVGSKKSELNLRFGGRFPAHRRVPGQVCLQNAPDRDGRRLLKPPENGGRRLPAGTLPGKPARR